VSTAFRRRSSFTGSPRLALVLGALLLSTSCGDGIDKAVAAIDNAIRQITGESGRWRDTLKDLSLGLDRGASQKIREISDELDGLVKGAIHDVPATAKCTADITPHR